MSQNISQNIITKKKLEEISKKENIKKYIGKNGKK